MRDLARGAGREGGGFAKHGVTSDGSEFTRSNRNPAKTVGPEFNDAVEWYNLPKP